MIASRGLPTIRILSAVLLFAVTVHASIFATPKTMVPVYVDPDVESAAMGLAVADKSYQVLSRTGDWVQIRFHTTSAWLKAQEVVFSESGDSSRRSPNAMGDLPPGQRVRVNERYVRLNIEPHPGSNALTFVTKNEELLVLGSVGDYYRVQYKSAIGFVPRKSCDPLQLSSTREVQASTPRPSAQEPPQREKDWERIASSDPEQGFSVWESTEPAAYTDTVSVSRIDSGKKIARAVTPLHRYSDIRTRAPVTHRDVPGAADSSPVLAPESAQATAPASPGEIAGITGISDVPRSPFQLPSRNLIMVIGAAVLFGMVLVFAFRATRRRRRRIRALDDAAQVSAPPTAAPEVASSAPVTELGRSEGVRMSKERYSLQGEIGPDTLSEIFQFLSESRKTGCLLVEDSDPFGIVYFDEGAIVHSVTKGRRDKDAIDEVLDLNRGRFRFLTAASLPRQTTHLSTMEVVMKWAQAKDERRAAKPQISRSAVAG